MSDTIEKQLTRYLAGVKDEGLNEIANLIDLETNFLKARWQVLSKVVPHMVFVNGYTLEITTCEEAGDITYIFNKRTTKEITIDYENFYIDFISKEEEQLGRVQLVDIEDILLINSDTGVLHDLCDILSFLSDEHVMPTQKPVTDNIIEVNFKTKKLM
ncbi:hypothetical protein AGENTSMITH_136 [Bacillus phage vB_BspM_AgentSmith]|nr:hypothetical protein AGENTSMITH_136 [Bacillus phage vB_BspM_AgentSmith]